MLALINRILDWFKSLFWKEEMELTLVGLQYSGKTTFVNVIAVCRQFFLSPPLSVLFLFTCGAPYREIENRNVDNTTYCSRFILFVQTRTREEL